MLQPEAIRETEFGTEDSIESQEVADGCLVKVHQSNLNTFYPFISYSHASIKFYSLVQVASTKQDKLKLARGSSLGLDL